MLEPKPDFKKLETKWQDYWLKEKVYKFDKASKKKVYSIDSPPPTLSAKSTHIGHAMSYTQFDFIGRYKRLSSYNVFLPMGIDDNGLPTERYVEQKLNINSRYMPRDEFNKIVMKELPEAREKMKEIFIKLGESYDWDLEYHTISKDSQKAAQLSFLDLYKKNLLSRREEPTIWCPKCGTATAQADVEPIERETKLNYIDFDVKSNGTLQIATTRPELLPACVGIFVNPQDKRYKNLIGKKAIVPLFNREVPIMKDEKADPQFGTGAVMICTFGDVTDIGWWKKHKLPLRIVIDEHGKLNKNAGDYAGLKLAEAREKIIQDLGRRLVKQQKLIQHVGTCWRCATPIEFIVTKQWMIKLLSKKQDFLKRAKQINWIPKFYKERYDQWVKNLDWDWIISRQRHFGVPLPVWYDKKGNIVLPKESELPVEPLTYTPKGYERDALIPETDVLDTWMTSSLTPEFALDWGSKNNLMKHFPMDLRPQAHDIIRTWAFYTIVKAHYHFNKIPWKNIMISGHLLDSNGRKMSKSLGNVIEPDEILEKYGADAWRYFVSTVDIGSDLSFQEKEILRGQKLVTKLWNVARFAEGKIKKSKTSNYFVDKWILNNLHKCIIEYKKNFDNYDPINARRALEQFFWHDFCDYYLEMAKPRLYGSNKKTKTEAESTLYECLLTILRMWAPFIPHVTEEIYQELFKKFEKIKSVHITEFSSNTKLYSKEESLGSTVKDIVSEIRKWKSEKNMSMGAEVDKLIVMHPKISIKEATKLQKEVMAIMRIKNLNLKSGKLRIL